MLLQLNNYGVAHMECRVDPRGDAPLLYAKPRGEKVGHPAMFLSLGNVNIMQLQKVGDECYGNMISIGQAGGAVRDHPRS